MFLNVFENMLLPCCKIVKDHIAEIGRILDKAKKKKKTLDIQKFRSKPFCKIKRSDGDALLNLNDIEDNYIKDFLKCVGALPTQVMQLQLKFCSTVILEVSLILLGF